MVLVITLLAALVIAWLFALLVVLFLALFLGLFFVLFLVLIMSQSLQLMKVSMGTLLKGVFCGIQIIGSVESS